MAIPEEWLLEDVEAPDGATLAVIAAAVAVVAGQGAVVRGVTPVAAQSPSSGWSRQGRVSLQSSHDGFRRRTAPLVKGASTA